MRHNNDEIIHEPVMYREVLDIAGYGIDKGENMFIDCTLGEGGHTELLLQTYRDLRIMGFERDAEILDIAKKRLGDYKERILFINDNFSNISGHLGDKIGKLSGFLYDFGISSFHFEEGGRGFSFSSDEYLDMRLDRNQKLNAHYIVNKYPEEKLSGIFRVYGEERWAKKIARVICALRKNKSIETSGELAGLIMRVIPRKYQVKNIHPATRVFQAIRIEVNDELNAIQKSLEDAYKYLAPGGVIIAISFHSLEDRIVKNLFRRLARGCVCSFERQHCTCSNDPFVSVLTKKPLIPKDDEVLKNRRSRSAKLRACVRL